MFWVDCDRICIAASKPSPDAVSYTHLDVYKRQTLSIVRVGKVKT